MVFEPNSINPVVIFDLDGTLALVNKRKDKADAAKDLALETVIDGYGRNEGHRERMKRNSKSQIYSLLSEKEKKEINSVWWETWENPNNIMLDEDNKPVSEILHMCSMNNYYIWIFSGRNDKCKAETLNWLRLHNIHYDELIMRSDLTDRYTNDAVLKERWLDEHILKHDLDVKMVFDDRKQVVDMWRKRGLTCLQVADSFD